MRRPLIDLSGEDFKGFKIKQLVLRESIEELKGFNCVWIDFWAWPRRRRTGRISKPQKRFKTDNRDRKGPNKFKFEGITMKEMFDTSQRGKGTQCRKCTGYGHI
ncbi:hypothetical protein M9H77_12186 [Catharanthus roseus]|uniref:Uncharacterized protein n=1 Tax=Catharanthus roseus TaxID=4058 RepID=A0ACC0BGS2_CATRO|nr:hypothetical protein M9H77_12186 [Catharanthus roseus]